jgi:hypothetical protein
MQLLVPMLIDYQYYLEQIFRQYSSAQGTRARAGDTKPQCRPLRDTEAKVYLKDIKGLSEDQRARC